MLELIQIPYSPFCLVQRRILEYAGVRFRTTSIPPSDRSLVWRLTRQRYYAVPILRDGRTVVFETDEDSQVLAKYLDSRLSLGLFPREWGGVQNLLWRYFEHEIEALGHKLTDIHFPEFLPRKEWLPFLRHKERRFGRGCVEQWRNQQSQLLTDLTLRLYPCEQMLLTRPFLLADRPLFVDFDLYGILANFLYTGHYTLPVEHDRLCDWYQRIRQITSSPSAA